MQRQYTIPEALGGGTMTVRQIAVKEQEAIVMQAATSVRRAAAGGSDEAAAVAAAKAQIDAQKKAKLRALVEYCGKRVDASNAEEAYYAMDPRHVALLHAAYDHLNDISEEDREAFLSSAVTSSPPTPLRDRAAG